MEMELESVKNKYSTFVEELGNPDHMSPKIDWTYALEACVSSLANGMLIKLDSLQEVDCMGVCEIDLENTYYLCSVWGRYDQLQRASYCYAAGISLIARGGEIHMDVMSSDMPGAQKSLLHDAQNFIRQVAEHADSLGIVLSTSESE